jgi:D-3-phosphoglycerate dehydrogenase / 2-oxoglutarate reductase
VPKWVVVFTDPRLHQPNRDQITRLEMVDAEFVQQDCKTEGEVLHLAAHANVLMVAAAPVSRKVISSLNGCLLIAKTGTGYDNIDVEAAGHAGIPVVNVSEFCTVEVAEHTMGMILDCARRITWSDRQIRQGIWDPSALLSASRLEGKTLGLVGYGKIGRAVAERATGFGMWVDVFDPYLDETLVWRDTIELRHSLEELLITADFVSLHLPLSSTTEGIIAEKQLRMMKPTAVLINCARGKVVDETALVKALEQGWIAGAGLDVFQIEPIPPSHTLLSLPNVVLTPHSAALSINAISSMYDQVIGEVVRVLSGLPPISVVNNQFLSK